MNFSKLTGVMWGAAMAFVPANASAQGRVQTFLDLQAGLGYSTNPLLNSGDDTGSVFARVSGYGVLAWRGERSATTLSGYVENSTYFNRYSTKQIFSLSAHTERSVSERVRIFGDLGFSGDIGGQLSSRIYAVPSAPVIPDPTVPPSFVGVDPTLYGLTGRQYRISGQVGAALTLTARDSLNVSAGAQRVFSGGDNNDLNYNLYDAAIGYDRQLNERLTVGGRLVAQHANYNIGGSVTSIGPQATVRAQLSEQWIATAAVGFVHTRQDVGLDEDTDSSVDLAVDGSLCRNLESERICARVARRSQSTVIGGASTSTSAGLEYYRRLNRRDTVQINAYAARAAALRAPFANQDSTFYTVAASFDRTVSDRLSAGANLSARRLSRVGPDPKTDLGGSVFVRYRVGDVR